MTSSRNWAGNFTYAASAIESPESLSELQKLVAASTKVKALGSRHSFNAIADTPGVHISTAKFGSRIEVDTKARRAIVDGASTYGALCPQLDRYRLAVPNLASLPHISVAGACATATHGSGDQNGNLATAVCGIEFVAADGSLVSYHRDQDPEFDGAVVGLGALGVVTRISLECVSSFSIAQHVYEWLPYEELETNFDRITSDAYSVSFFTDWSGPAINQVWFKRRVLPGETPHSTSRAFGAKRAPHNLHPIKEISPVNCTEQMGIPGPSFERLPHFRMDFMPSAGDELQSEYLVPRVHALEAIRTIRGLHIHVSRLLQVSEVRSIAADHLWMSPNYGQPCIGIHFTWKPDWPAVSKVLPEIEQALAPFRARPHWGKLFTMSPDRVSTLYERLPAFRRLAEKHDPKGKFRNEFLDRYIFG